MIRYFCDRGSDQRAASSICLTKEIRLAAAHSPWPSNANIARSRRQRRGLRPARATGHPMDLRRCCPKPDNHQGSVSPTVQNALRRRSRCRFQQTFAMAGEAQLRLCAAPARMDGHHGTVNLEAVPLTTVRGQGHHQESCPR